MQRRGRRPFRGPFSGVTSTDRAFRPNNDRLCFSCKKTFPSQAFLEEHCCPALTHICSCGTEFPLYSKVVAHSKTHQPGHSIDHKTIVRRRYLREQQDKVQRSASSLSSPASSLELVSKYQVPMQFSPNSFKMSKLSHGSAAPTVDLWTVYKPVVLLKTHTLINTGPYRCANCSQNFSTKSNLVLHCNSHAIDKVFGCVGCGTLLSSSKSLPEYHLCNSPSGSLGPAVITTHPLCGQKPDVAPVARTLMPSNTSKAFNVTTATTVHLNTFTQPHSNPSKMPMQATFAMNPFSCGVCCVAFDSVKLLQRHKCLEAQRSVHHTVPPRPQASMKWRSITTTQKRPYPLPQTARIKNHTVAPCGIVNANAYQHKTAVLSNGLRGQAVSEKKDLDSDDDCYIIESPTIKPNNTLCNVSSLS